MISNEDLKAMKELCEKATPGPWESFYRLPGNECDTWEVIGVTGADLNGQDAQFIAHARTDMERLIAEVERLTAMLFSMQNAAIDLASQLSERDKEVERLRSIPIHVADGNNDPAHWPWTEQTLGALIDD